MARRINKLHKQISTADRVCSKIPGKILQILAPLIDLCLLFSLWSHFTFQTNFMLPTFINFDLHSFNKTSHFILDIHENSLLSISLAHYHISLYIYQCIIPWNVSYHRMYHTIVFIIPLNVSYPLMYHTLGCIISIDKTYIDGSCEMLIRRSIDR